MGISMEDATNAADTMFLEVCEPNDAERLRGGTISEAPSVTGTEEEEEEDNKVEERERPVVLPVLNLRRRRRTRKLRKLFKIGAFLLIWLGYTGAFMANRVPEEQNKLLVVPTHGTLDELLVGEPKDYLMSLLLHGNLVLLEDEDIDSTKHTPTLNAQVQRVYYDANNKQITVENASTVWQLELMPVALVKQVNKRRHIFELEKHHIMSDSKMAGACKLRLHMSTSDFDETVPLQVAVNMTPINKEVGAIYAALVLLFLYVLIIWDIVGRTFAAIMASCTAIGVLSLLNARPSMHIIINWIGFETLLLLFSMMVMVAVLSDTGVFDYLAVFAYKVTRGHVWPLIACLCLFTGIVSSLLDNVTMVLLMTPVTIRLCEVMGILTSPVLISMVIFSNIGGCMTAVGDPPNVIIVSNLYLARNGVNFYSFLQNVFPCAFIAMLVAYLQLRIHLRNDSSMYYEDSTKLTRLRHNIATWQRAAAKMMPYSQNEERVRDALLDTAKELKQNLRQTRMASRITQQISNHQQTVKELEAKYPIRDKKLLIKALIALTCVIFLFCQRFLPITMDWAALLGAILLLILANKMSLEHVMNQIEWSTLIFFAALFILMEAVAEMGLIVWISEQILEVVNSVSEKYRLAVAILIVLWTSALTSAVVDNIPITTMMIKLIIELNQNKTGNMPLLPLVWALALGVCLGGNGTLIGASANVVCSGVAAHHGYGFSFMDFFKIGFPVMIGSIIVSSVYLIVSHVLLTGH